MCWQGLGGTSEEVRDQQGLARGWSASKFYCDDSCQPSIGIKGLGFVTRSLFTFLSCPSLH